MKINKGMEIRIKLPITPYAILEIMERAEGFHRKSTNAEARPPIQNAKGRPVTSNNMRQANRSNVIMVTLMSHPPWPRLLHPG